MFIKIFMDLLKFELSMSLRSPVWILSLFTALFFAWTESGSDLFSWPTVNQSLCGYQKSCSIILVLAAFFITSHAVLRDWQPRRRELYLTKPFHPTAVVGTKFLCGFIISLGIALILLTFSYMRPILGGAHLSYELRPFMITILCATIPSLLFTCSLAVFLSLITRRMILVLPIFLLYFFYALVKSAQYGDHSVAMADFRMELQPQTIRLGLNNWTHSLSDFSFASYLNPIPYELIFRAELYLGLLLVLLMVSSWILHRRRV